MARKAWQKERKIELAPFFVQLILSMLVAFPVTLLVRHGIGRWKKQPYQPTRELWFALFVSFSIGLAWLVFQPGNANAVYGSGFAALGKRLAEGNAINIKPFRTIGGFVRNGLGTGFYINIVANVFMFLPLGFLLPFLWSRWRRFYRMLGMSLLIPVVIEFIQLFIGRSVDVDDIILNAIGILLGYVFYVIFAKVKKKMENSTR